MTLIQELRWRGMIQDIMPGTEELFEKEQVSGYIGFDPTTNTDAPISLPCSVEIDASMKLA